MGRPVQVQVLSAAPRSAFARSSVKAEAWNLRKYRRRIILFILFVVLVTVGILYARSRVVRGVSGYLTSRYPELSYEVRTVTPVLLPPGANVRVYDNQSGVTFDTYLRYHPPADVVNAEGTPVADPNAQQILTDLRREVRRFSFTNPQFVDNYKASLTKAIASLELEPLLKNPEFTPAIADWTLTVTGEDPTVPTPQESSVQLILRWNRAVLNEQEFVDHVNRFDQALSQMEVESLTGCTFQSIALPLDPAAFEAIGASAATWREEITRLPDPTTVPLETTSINPMEMSPEDWEAIVDSEETTVEIIGVSSGYVSEWYYYTISLNDSFRPYSENDLKNGLRLIELSDRDKRIFDRHFDD